MKTNLDSPASNGSPDKFLPSDHEEFAGAEGNFSYWRDTYYTRGRIIRMCIRWILTIALYYFFWHISWVRWSLWIVAPMVAINLGALLYF